MRKAILILVSMIFVMTCITGCGEDSPADPGGGGGGDTNHSPGAPTINTAAGAPADNATGVAISADLHWNCTDADGDDLTFDVHFGTSDPPALVSSDQTAEMHDPGTLAYSTEYFWKVVATDPDDESTSSATWSFTTMDEPAETVTIPNVPTGPAAGETGESLAYTTGGSSTSQGHTVQYQFDWGDGSFSSWSTNTTVSYSWSSDGNYSVRARARCQSHTAVESDWSDVLSVDITAPAGETVSAPTNISGPASVFVDQSYQYSLSGAFSSEGHTLEYRIDWGDGDISMWSSQNYAFKTWTATGTYDVIAQARCQDHPDIESAWSTVYQVEVTEPSENVYRPSVTTWPEYGAVGEEYQFYAQHAYSDLYHTLEYRFDFGDGTVTDWGVSMPYYYAYSTTGIFDVRAQARCAEHTDAVSDWSNIVQANISDTEMIVDLSLRNPSYDSEHDVGASVLFWGEGSSTFGHVLQFRFDTGDGTITDWGGERQYHTYSSSGLVDVRVQARCRDHPDIESAWSDPRTITILEAISQPTISGPATGTAGQELTFTATGATSSDGHELEYRLWISTWYASAGTAQAWTTIDNLTYTFDTADTYYVRVQARCVTDTAVESLPSAYMVVTISP
jgi:hypothetical protein